MRFVKDPEGKRRFEPCEWLTHEQIQCFASFAIKARQLSNPISQPKRLKLEEVNKEEGKLLENIIGSLQTVQANANELEVN
jgi:hypothetical protein